MKLSNEIIKWKIRRPCKIFGDKYDNLTDIVTKIASTDDLLAGNYFVGYSNLYTHIKLPTKY